MKKSAGSDKTLIIDAACTARSVLVLTLASRSVLMPPAIMELVETHTINTASDIRTRTLPLSRTSENIRFVSFGVSRPISVTARVAIPTITKSDTESV